MKVKMEIRTYLTISSDNRREALRAAGKLPNGENALEYDRSQKLWFAKPEADLEKLKAWLPENTVTGNVETRGNNLTPAEEFALALSTAGFILPDNGLPEMDGKRHRVATEGDKHGSKSGVYQGYMDGRPAGWYENHRSSEGKQNWVSTGNYTFDPALAMQQRAQQAQKRWDREVEQQAGFARMSENLTHQWSKMPAATHTHPYLARKGVPAAEGVRLDKYGNLVIPLRNTEGAIRSLQYIKPDGTKNLKKDAEKTGNFFVVGGELLPGQPILYAEGYATAASLHLATGSPVVMTVDAGNMVTVSQNLQARYPDVPHIILGEDDFTKKDNKGAAKAREAAEKIGGTYLIPTFTDDERAQAFAGTASFSDFNDIHHSRGLDAVRDQLAPVLDPLIPDWRQSLSEEKTMDTPPVPSTDTDDPTQDAGLYADYAETLQQELLAEMPVQNTPGSPDATGDEPAETPLSYQAAGSEMPLTTASDAAPEINVATSQPTDADITPEVAVSQPSDAETGPDVTISPLIEPEATGPVMPVPETLPEENVSQPPMPNVDEIPVRQPESATREEKPAPEAVVQEPQVTRTKPESEEPDPEEIPVRSPGSAAEEEQPAPETAAEEPQAAKANPEREGEEPEEDAIVVGPPRPAGAKPDTAIPNVDKDALLARLTWETQDNETVLYKLDGEPAFVDHGTRLAMAEGASDSDEKVLAALLTAAQYYRGRIELTGSEAFKAKAIGLIARHEINVSMKSPAQQAMLESARRELNKAPVEDDAVRGDMAPDTPPMAAPSSSNASPAHEQNPQQAKQPVPEPPVGQPERGQDAPQQPGPETAPPARKAPQDPDVPREADGGHDPSVHQSYQKAKNGVMGKVISCGPAPFRFDENNTQSIHIKLRTKEGIQTFWGKELAGLLRQTRIQPGRVVSLKWEGKEAVTIQVPTRENGVITGYEPKQAHRNQWTLTPVGSASVRSGTDEGVKLSAVDAQRFAQIQASVISTLGIDIPPFSQPNDGLFWLRPDGQGSQTPGDALSAPRPSPDRQAGKVIVSRSATDGKLDMCLVQSDGPYLQGVVRHQGEYRHVLVSLPDNKDAPPMVINMVTPDGIVPIGCGNGINRSDGQPVPREHLAFRLEGDKAVRIGKLDSPSDVPPALHARLGFDERWREEVAPPKTAPAAAPRPDDLRPA